MSLNAHTIVDQYEILAPLGAGGMGEVYRARDSRLNREVAIKVLPELFSSDPDRLQRFYQEARAAAALNHPNILAVYQMGSYEGVPYLVSELLEGETLRERLNRGPLPWRKVVDYGAQIARGLAAAHAKGIIHRDLKPENLFIVKDGQVKILDFGLARMMQPKAAATEGQVTPGVNTEPGILMGTVGYMSPEQVRGKVADHRSDIFAFSVILHEMLSGKRAFHKSAPAETMSAILNEEPQPIAELAPGTPLGMHRVLHRGLEKNPEERFQSASDLGFALEALSDATHLTLPVAQAMVEKKSYRLRPAIVGVAFIVLAGMGTLAYLWTRPAPVPKVANYVQLTHDGLQKSLIGTDGSRIYLTLINSGMQDVASIPVAGGVQTNIPMPSQNMVPVDLSPDGLAFLVVDGHGFPTVGPLWSLPVQGGSPRRLGDAVGHDASWSPDGRIMAYSNAGAVFLQNADGTQPRKLLLMNVLISDLLWSPDGSHLRFDTSDYSQSGVGGTGVGEQQLWEIAADGSNPHRLLADSPSALDECCGQWTADGKYFVFQSQGQIWALPQESRFRRSKSAPIELTSSPMSLFSPLPSKDGKKLFVVGRTYRGELTRYVMKTRAFSPVFGGISAEYVAYSKDGQWAAYVAYPEGTLWKCKADGSQRVQLTFAPLRAAAGPRWSPDGRTIAFFSFPLSATQPGRIYTISADGGSPRELMPDDRSNHMDPTWSPDGTRIAFGADANDSAVKSSAPGIHLLDMRTGKVADVPGSQGLFSPRWSPDGQHLAAMTANSGTIMLFDFQTQKWTQLARGTFGWLEWSRDGQNIYLKDFAGKGAVARIRISDRKLEQVADLNNFSDTGRAGGSLSLMPDDSPLLLRDTGTQDVYALAWIAP